MDTTMPANTLYRRNIYSEELLKTLYIDPGRALLTMTMRHMMTTMMVTMMMMTTMMMTMMMVEFNQILKPGLGFIKEQDTSAAAGEKVSIGLDGHRHAS